MLVTHILHRTMLPARLVGGRAPGLTPHVRSVSSVGATAFMQAAKTRPRAEFQVVDVREPSELQIASLKNTLEVVNLPLSEMDQWSSVLSNHLDDSKTIYCLCHHGVRSMRMAQYLEKECGFDDVVNITGGIDAIAQEVDSSIGFY
jgi:rhodanese-related sulfurtransferase